MVRMIKGNTVVYVPNAFVMAYADNGFSELGKEHVDAAAEAVPEKLACPYCGKEYAKQAALDKHIAEKHAE